MHDFSLGCWGPELHFCCVHSELLTKGAISLPAEGILSYSKCIEDRDSSELSAYLPLGVLTDGASQIISSPVTGNSTTSKCPSHFQKSQILLRYPGVDEGSLKTIRKQ